MARQGKQGIDYFSHDVHACSDRKLKLLMAKHNVIGYGVFFLLLQDLYKEGYSLKLDEDYILLFISDNHLTEDIFYDILDDCIKFNLFDSNCYKSYKILTSKRTQDNYLEAIKRRKDVIIEKDTWLLSFDNLPKNVKVNGFDSIPEEPVAGIFDIEDLQEKEFVDDVENFLSDDQNNDVPKAPKKKSIKPTEEKLKFHKNAVSHIPEYLNNKKFYDAFEEWEKLRAKKKCATSDRRYKQIFKEINEFSGNDLEIAIKIVNRSADKGYTDLYALSNNVSVNKPTGSNKKKVVDVPNEVVDLRGKL